MMVYFLVPFLIVSMLTDVNGDKEHWLNLADVVVTVFQQHYINLAGMIQDEFGHTLGDANETNMKRAALMKKVESIPNEHVKSAAKHVLTAIHYLSNSPMVTGENGGEWEDWADRVVVYFQQWYMNLAGTMQDTFGRMSGYTKENGEKREAVKEKVDAIPNQYVKSAAKHVLGSIKFLPSS